VTQIRPHAIFAAHDHKSVHISADKDTGEERLAEMLLPSAGPVWQYQLNAGLVHEFMVPTCSYRMGAVDMGYGAAIIGKLAVEVICSSIPKSAYEPYEYRCCYFPCHSHFHSLGSHVKVKLAQIRGF
jgi:hypothetical protein